MLDRGCICVNSRHKLNRIMDGLKKEGRRGYYEVFMDDVHTYYWIMYRVRR